MAELAWLTSMSPWWNWLHALAAALIQLALLGQAGEVPCVPEPTQVRSFRWESRGAAPQVVTLAAFLPAKESSKPRGSAVLVLHGADGAAANAAFYRTTAHRLAQEGHQVFILPYFTGRDYSDLLLRKPDGKLDTAAIEAKIAADKSHYLALVRQTLHVIAQEKGVDEKRIALVGYSLGTLVALSAAQASCEDPATPDVTAVVGNWGSVFADDRFDDKLPPVCLIHGGKDDIIPLWKTQAAVSKLMSRGATDIRLKVYPGEPHVFENPKAIADSWKTTIRFLDAHLAD